MTTIFRERLRFFVSLSALLALTFITSFILSAVFVRAEEDGVVNTDTRVYVEAEGTDTRVEVKQRINATQERIRLYNSTRTESDDSDEEGEHEDGDDAREYSSTKFEKREDQKAGLRAVAAERIEEARKHREDERHNLRVRINAFKTDHASGTGNSVRDKEEREAERTAREEARRQERIERIKAYLERMFRRFDAAVDRLYGLSDRIDARIEKLTEKGFDLTEASELLVEAQVHIDAAGLAVVDARAVVASITDTKDMSEFVALMRASAGNAKDAIKDAHAALVASIRAVKASGRADTGDDQDDDDDDDTATTTDDTATTTTN